MIGRFQDLGIATGVYLENVVIIDEGSFRIHPVIPRQAPSFATMLQSKRTRAQLSKVKFAADFAFFSRRFGVMLPAPDAMAEAPGVAMEARS
jgi:hypothetical protein